MMTIPDPHLVRQLKRAEQELPPAEANLFKTLLRHFEQKAHKKGLRLADTLLKKHPNHGETLAMKGLFLSALEKKEEAFEFVRQGLKMNIMSHICWHVYGLLWRSEKNYEEAVKCYRHALKYDKANLQILRDFSMLQIQLRNYEEFNASRKEILTLRPQQKQHWICVALSYHLINNYVEAVKVLDMFMASTIIVHSNPPDYEHSEFLLYKIHLLSKISPKKAYDALIANENYIVDRHNCITMKAKLLDSLNRRDESKVIWSELVTRNADSEEAILGWLGALDQGLNLDNLGEDKARSYSAKLAHLHNLHESSSLIPRLRLSLLPDSSEELEEALEAYLTPRIKRGIPSLFIDVQGLYASKHKRDAIQRLFTTHQIAQLSLEKKPDWHNLFLAQHYAYEDNWTQAFSHLHKLDGSKEVAVYMIWAKILKRAGSIKAAQEMMEKARLMDASDRYMNSKAVKYHLRANAISKAEECIVMFVREGPSQEERLQELVDMQSMWYALEAGEACMRKKLWGKALKKFHQIEKHFADWVDDQFDFHSYCLRKMTLLNYVDMLRLEDNLRSNPFFLRAARRAVAIYTHLYDNANEITQQVQAQIKAKEEQEAAKPKTAEAELQDKIIDLTLSSDEDKENQKDGKEEQPTPPKKVDSDPEGFSYLDVKEPSAWLSKCEVFIQPLQELAADRVETHVLSFEIAMRQQKAMLAIRCIQNCKRLATMDKYDAEKSAAPQLEAKLQHHLLLTRFVHLTKNVTLKIPSELEVIYKQALDELQDSFTSKDLLHNNDQFTSYWSSQQEQMPLDTFNTGLRELAMINVILAGEDGKENALKVIAQCQVRSTGLYRREALKIYESIGQAIKAWNGDFGAYKEKCRALYPHADAFA